MEDRAARLTASRPACPRVRSLSALVESLQRRMIRRSIAAATAPDLVSTPSLV